MFITKPEFQHHVPDALKLSPDSTYWAAVFLSTEAHWYLLSYRAGPGADTVTVAVAWESDLLSILEVLGREAISIPAQSFLWALMVQSNRGSLTGAWNLSRNCGL